MSLDNVHDYPEPVWRRFAVPHHAGRLSGEGSYVARAGTPAAGSVLELSVQRAAGGVQDARFRAHGCPFVIAVGQWLAEGLATGAITAPITAAQIRDALEIPEEKAHCAFVGEDVLRALWNQMK